MSVAAAVDFHEALVGAAGGRGPVDHGEGGERAVGVERIAHAHAPGVAPLGQAQGENVAAQVEQRAAGAELDQVGHGPVHGEALGDAAQVQAGAGAGLGQGAAEGVVGVAAEQGQRRIEFGRRGQSPLPAAKAPQLHQRPRAGVEGAAADLVQLLGDPQTGAQPFRHLDGRTGGRGVETAHLRVVAPGAQPHIDAVEGGPDHLGGGTRLGAVPDVDLAAGAGAHHAVVEAVDVVGRAAAGVHGQGRHERQDQGHVRVLVHDM